MGFTAERKDRSHEFCKITDFASFQNKHIVLESVIPIIQLSDKGFSSNAEHNLCCRLWNKRLGLFFILGGDDTKVSLRVSIMVWSHKAGPVAIVVSS